MDQFNQQNQPQPLQTTPVQPAPAPEHKKVGPIIAVLIIVLVLIIAALYLFASKINQEQTPNDSAVATQDEQTAVSPAAEVKAVTSKSDDLKSLQDDLNSSTQGLQNSSF